MTTQEPDSRYLMDATQRRARERALTRDFEAFLAPGERMGLQIEVAPEFELVQLILGKRDDSMALTLEAARLQEDTTKSLRDLPTDDAIELLLVFLRVQLYEYFRSDRVARFHEDWTQYMHTDETIRFRGELRSPLLDAATQDLLGENVVVEERR